MQRTIPPELLLRQLTPAQAEAEHLITDEALGPDPVPFGYMHSVWLQLLAQMQPDDELWQYRTPPETWKRMCGREGLVLLRKGKVVVHLLLEMN